MTNICFAMCNKDQTLFSQVGVVIFNWIKLFLNCGSNIHMAQKEMY